MEKNVSLPGKICLPCMYYSSQIKDNKRTGRALVRPALRTLRIVDTSMSLRVL